MTLRTRVEAAALTVARAGGAPSYNEDSVKFATGRGSPEAWADFVAVVADGVGTSREPAAASQAAVDTWVQFLERRFTERPSDLAAFDDGQFGHLLRECFAQAHRQVQKAAPGGSATAAGVCIQGPWLLAATVGDSRVYHFTGGELRQLTDDQIDAGGNPTDVLGGRAVAPAVESYARPSLTPGDWIVACSDGLGKTVNENDLIQILRVSETPLAAVKAMKVRVQAKGVDDDVTAVFARVEEVGEPFWAGSGVQGSGDGDRGLEAGNVFVDELSPESPYPLPDSPRGRKSPKAPPIPDRRSPPPRNEVTMDPNVPELERRLERLERTPNGGTLSVQENARLEREFERLEALLRDLEEKVSHAARLPVGWIAAALVAGLALGALLPAALSRVQSGGVPSKDPTVAGTTGGALQAPTDLRALLDTRLTDTALVLRYDTKDGKQKVAVYPFASAGKPSVVYTLPAAESAPNYGKTESEHSRASPPSRRGASRRPNE